jgi:hypothetical protein
MLTFIKIQKMAFNRRSFIQNLSAFSTAAVFSSLTQRLGPKIAAGVA